MSTSYRCKSIESKSKITTYWLFSHFILYSNLFLVEIIWFLVSCILWFFFVYCIYCTMKDNSSLFCNTNGYSIKDNSSLLKLWDVLVYIVYCISDHGLISLLVTLSHNSFYEEHLQQWHQIWCWNYTKFDVLVSCIIFLTSLTMTLNFTQKIILY